MELYSSMSTAVTPLSVGDGKVCTIVKVAVSCSGGGGNTSQTNCYSMNGTCTNGSC